MKLRVAGCFLEYNGKFLILHRRPDKSQGDKWGLPAGKVDRGETDIQAVLRELKEETGYKASPDELEFLGEINWKFAEKEVDFPTFRIKLEKPIQVKHQPDEHMGYKWVTAEECYKMDNLIHGLHNLLEIIGYIKKS